MHREARVSNYILGVLLGVSLILLSLPMSVPVQTIKTCLIYAIDPAVYYGAKGVERLSDAPTHVRDLLMADTENRRMREEIRSAAWTLAQAQELKKENGRLRAALGIKSLPGFTPLWARVMERDPLHWYRSLVVDVGVDHGVRLNAPVLGQAGENLVAIGRVVEVRPRSSLVLLLTDELSSVAAYLSSSTLEGLVQGQGNSRLLMNYLSSDVTIQNSDEVRTSVTSATFPPGMLIGSLVKINSRDPFLTFQSAEIQSALDASSLKAAVILKKMEVAAERP